MKPFRNDKTIPLRIQIFSYLSNFILFLDLDYNECFHIPYDSNSSTFYYSGSKVSMIDIPKNIEDYKLFLDIDIKAKIEKMEERNIRIVDFFGNEVCLRNLYEKNM